VPEVNVFVNQKSYQGRQPLHNGYHPVSTDYQLIILIIFSWLMNLSSE